MKIGLYLKVMWRFRFLVAAGFVLAVVLAFLSVARVDLNNPRHVAYRSAETWISRSTILITQQRFPEGRSVFEQTVPASSQPKPTQFAPSFADPSRFIELANLYAQLATSDPVERLVRQGGPLHGTVQATPTVTSNGAAALPLLSINGIATTPRGAIRLASRAVQAFVAYLQVQQERAGVPEKQRVLLQVVDQPQRAELLRGRPKTLSIVVFMAVFLTAIGIAMLLENLRPRAAPVTQASLAPVVPQPSQMGGELHDWASNDEDASERRAAGSLLGPSS
jgi:hypothetical protein